MNIKAVIFDLDGVLVSTDVLHKESLVEAISRYTGKESLHLLPSEKSMLSTKQKLKIAQHSIGFDDSIYFSILSEKDRIFNERIHLLSVSDSVIETLEFVVSLGIKTAIASNSRLINILNVLEATKLRRFFSEIVSAEEVNLPKPAPDILYKVYCRLQLDPSDYKNTLFIEDSDEGAAAGYNSPSTVIKINSPLDLTKELLIDWIDNVHR